MTNKGARWFVQHGATTNYSAGFKSKNEASEYIDGLQNIEWRAGFVFRLMGDTHDRCIVNRKGEVAKP